MTKRLGGDHQGGYGSGITGGKKSASGVQGGGTIAYKQINPKKDIIGGERQPMPNETRGRVLYSSKNKRIGRQEGTGSES